MDYSLRRLPPPLPAPALAWKHVTARAEAGLQDRPATMRADKRPEEEPGNKTRRHS
jgi:hypothetical protein